MTPTEIDALVAEKVMGWHRWDTFRDQAHTMPVTMWVRPDRKHPTGCPAFSTDLLAAWQVVEKMREDGFSVAIADVNASEWCMELFSHTGLQIDCVRYVGGPLPTAICLAALKTKGVEA